MLIVLTILQNIVEERRVEFDAAKSLLADELHRRVVNDHQRTLLEEDETATLQNLDRAVGNADLIHLHLKHLDRRIHALSPSRRDTVDRIIALEEVCRRLRERASALQHTRVKRINRALLDRVVKALQPEIQQLIRSVTRWYMHRHHSGSSLEETTQKGRETEEGASRKAAAEERGHGDAEGDRVQIGGGLG